MSKALFPLLLILILLPRTSHAAITNYSVKNVKGVSEVILEVDKKVAYKSFLLENPNRLVVDVIDAPWRVGEKGIVNLGYWGKQLRHGNPSADTTRVVLDLSEKVHVIKSVLARKGNGYAIVIALSDKAPVSTSSSSSKKNEPKSLSSGYGGSPFSMPTFAPPKKRDYRNSIYDDDDEKPRSQKKPTRTVELAKPPAANDTAPISTRAYRKPIVVIDPGHGGVDPGAIGRAGTREKDITLSYSLALRDALRRTGHYDVVLTRSSDHFVKLNKRVDIARAAKGDLFISIHADSHPDSSTRGLSVYTISERRAKYEANKLVSKATRERQVIADVDLSHESKDVQAALIDLVQRDTKNTSAGFAELLLNEMNGEARLLRRPHRDGSLAVLTGADIPSVLLELGYLSNRKEEKLLNTSSHKKRLVNGIARTVERYFEEFSG